MSYPVANVSRFLPETAARIPDDAAVRLPMGEDAASLVYKTLSFQELETQSNATAAYLHSRGVVKGQRVLLMVKPGLNLILVTFALFKLGAVPVVIDPGMGLRSFLRCVAVTKPETLVGIPLAILISRVFCRPFRSLRYRISINRGFEESIFSMGTVEPISEKTQSDELAGILFTSGSTGAPKGVRYTQGTFEAQVASIKAFYGIEPGEVDLTMLPVFALFDPALGMTSVVPDMNPSKPATVDPAHIVKAIQQNGVTNSFGSPVLWTKIGRYCQAKGICLPSIKRILMAGAPVSPDLIESFKRIIPNGEIHTPYGATECLPISSISGTEVLAETAALSRQGKGTCVGYPIAGNRIEILKISDEAIAHWDDALLLGPGEVGEIVVKGPVVTASYDRREEETRKAKISDAEGCVWHRMGDLGYKDDQGRIWFCGRKAERVEVAETIYYTDCCEAIFNQHPRVYRSALIGLERSGVTYPAMVIEPEAGTFPKTKKAKAEFIEELKKLGASRAHTQSIADFYFWKKFPVDVRHNAKIHRLSMRHKVQKRR